jgi:chloride channel protein, CIC family
VLAGRTQRGRRVRDVMVAPVAVAYPDEILRTVADRMAGLGVGVLPVVDRADPARMDGLVTQFDLLQARERLLAEERHAERVLLLRRVSGRVAGRPAAQRASSRPN